MTSAREEKSLPLSSEHAYVITGRAFCISATALAWLQRYATTDDQRTKIALLKEHNLCVRAPELREFRLLAACIIELGYKAIDLAAQAPSFDVAVIVERFPREWLPSSTMIWQPAEGDYTASIVLDRDAFFKRALDRFIEEKNHVDPSLIKRIFEQSRATQVDMVARVESVGRPFAASQSTSVPVLINERRRNEHAGKLQVHPDVYRLELSRATVNDRYSEMRLVSVCVGFDPASLCFATQ